MDVVDSPEVPRTQSVIVSRITGNWLSKQQYGKSGPIEWEIAPIMAESAQVNFAMSAAHQGAPDNTVGATTTELCRFRQRKPLLLEWYARQL